MKSKNRKQAAKRKSAKRQSARAIARWENEGGAPKSPAQEIRERSAVLAAEEERILRCLGAALIMQWNDLPRGIQRSLFEYAVSMGEPRETAALKGQIARFLHTHKDAKQK
jgi:hypothetical protein